ncbi:hypothetical protein AB0M46_40570 [Dactylosporangium sp. NPDC051485]|uniref:hypothetical protein n=1 Tax=Dactylosporangium sp. NPDC051485 TaxID=3154846 RepID=UPI0034300680
MWTGRWRPVAAGALALLALAGAAVAACRATDGSEGPAVWRAYPGAFTAPAGATAAATLLMPAPDGCFYAIGPVDAGQRRWTGTWRGTADCATVRREWPVELPPTSPQITERETVVDAVEGPQDWLTVSATTAGDAAWATTSRGTPEHWEAGQLRTPRDAAGDVPAGIGVVRGRFAVVGLHGTAPTVYLSPGYGPWDDRPLPQPRNGGDDVRPLAVAGAPGRYRLDSGTRRLVEDVGPAVAVGRSGDRAVVWTSRDGGAEWSADTPAGATELTDVVHDGSAFVAVGAAGRSALVLTSDNGSIWAPDRRGVPAGALPWRAVFALRPPTGRGEPMVLGGPAAPPPAVYAVGPAAEHDCATAWRRDEGAWVAEPLGCHGVPTALLRLPDGRIAAVSGTTLLLRQHL